MDKKTLPVFCGPDPPRTAETDQPPDPAREHRLFIDAMAGVKPMAQDKVSPGTQRAKTGSWRQKPYHHRCEVLGRLEKLIQSGEGFCVADTPEYQEGVGHRVHPLATRDLHQGRFSIQDHIDLHGLSVTDAQRAVDDFLQASIRSGKRAVLVVHGRGLSSPGPPVLKTMVRRWLTRGTWRTWVMAFASARLCDGGAGATYVLLRERPLTRQFRKNRRSDKSS
ncbi:MAG: Smr/MutS family protein [Desulfobacterales bacterium]